MPQSLLVAATTSLLLISRLSTTYAAVDTDYGYEYFDLQHNYCQIEAGGYGYDLCPLMNRINLVEGRGFEFIADEEDTSTGEIPESGRRLYEVVLGGSKDEEIKTSSQYMGISCPEGTWVCLIEMGYVEINNKFVQTPKKSTAISRKLNGFRAYWTQNVISSLTVDKDEDENPLSLTMKLHGSAKRKDLQASEITFSCSDLEYLVYKGDDGGVHSFLWATPQGCPIELARPDCSRSHTSTFTSLILHAIESIGDSLPRGRVGFAIALVLSFTIIITLTSAVVALLSMLATAITSLYPNPSPIGRSVHKLTTKAESSPLIKGVNGLVCSTSSPNTKSSSSSSDSGSDGDSIDKNSTSTSARLPTGKVGKATVLKNRERTE